MIGDSSSQAVITAELVSTGRGGFFHVSPTFEFCEFSPSVMRSSQMIQQGWTYEWHLIRSNGLSLPHHVTARLPKVWCDNGYLEISFLSAHIPPLMFSSRKCGLALGSNKEGRNLFKWLHFKEAYRKQLFVREINAKKEIFAFFVVLCLFYVTLSFHLYLLFSFCIFRSLCSHIVYISSS